MFLLIWTTLFSNSIVAERGTISYVISILSLQTIIEAKRTILLFTAISALEKDHYLARL